MTETRGRRFVVKKLELPKARVFNREPYFMVSLVSENGEEIDFVTEPARGVKRGKPLALDLVLFETSDLDQWIAASVLVMESDEDFRNFGRKLDEVRGAVDGSGVGRRLKKGLKALDHGGILSWLDKLHAIASSLLQDNGDDVLAETMIKFNFGDLKLGPFTFDGDKARITFELQEVE